MLRGFAFLVLLFILLVVWFVGWPEFHIAAGGMLPALAVIFLLMDLFRGGRRTV